MKNNPEVKSELTFELEDSGDGVTILIKHDYYSSDSDHGRELFAAMIDSIKRNYKIDQILLVDSGVRVLDSDLLDVTNLSSYVLIYVCGESLAAYGITAPAGIEVIDKSSFFDILINSKNVFTIE
ncbi:MAG: hypothetical protein J6Z43_09555 [Clostridiales bacterium]|nr:hypothetical protein [Clostridiales bacterium]